jgi:tRNA pseudouridine55 synthase
MRGAGNNDKPAGWTSHDVVGRVRRLAGTRRVGHTGTLDPFATGVLVVCLGRATRLSQLLTGCDKEYLATMRLGWATDTQDCTGERVGPVAASERIPDDAAPIRRVLEDFEGEQEQLPPMYSAKKVGGKALYKSARAGKEVERRPVRVRAHLEMLAPGDAPLERNADGTVDVPLLVECSAGTYVRTLAHDIGARLGCGAHLAALRRTRVGPFGVERAATLEELEAYAVRGALAERLVPPGELVAGMPAVTATDEEAARVLHGVALRLGSRVNGADRADCAIFAPGGELLAVARVDLAADAIRPRIVLAE